MAVITLKVREGTLVDVRFLVRGCPAAIATCSITTELVKGKTLQEAEELTDEAVAEALGGLPEAKLHCSNLAATALHNALADYRRRQKVDLHNWRSLYGW